MDNLTDYYYQVHLEVVLRGTDYVFGFINISHISFQEFEEIFLDQVTDERFLFDNGMSYFIEEELYLSHKEFMDKKIPFTFNFELFEYSVALTGNLLSKLRPTYYLELPKPFII